ERDGFVPEVPALLIPDAHGEAERVGALGERERSEPADEVLLISCVIRRLHRVRGAEADDVVAGVEQLELRGKRVLRRAPARPEVDFHDVARVEPASDAAAAFSKFDAPQVVMRRWVDATCGSSIPA